MEVVAGEGVVAMAAMAAIDLQVPQVRRTGEFELSRFDPLLL